MTQEGNRGSDSTRTAPLTDLKKAVVKAAKKALKKEQGGSLKLVELASRIAKKLDTDHVEAVRVELLASSKLVVQDHLVSLKPKNKGTPPKKRARADNDKDNKAPTKKAKKSKKNAKRVETTPDATAASTPAPAPATVNNNVRDMAAWRQQHKIVVKHSRDDQEGQALTQQLNQTEDYFPFTSFDDPRCQSSLHKALLRQCTKVNGFVQPSPIQAQAWPILTQAMAVPPNGTGTSSPNARKRDVVGIAETGSGKTLAFALPALSALSHASAAKSGNRRRQPRMLVLSPTRELAMQSHAVLEEFGAVVGLQSLVVYGGVPKHVQAAPLKRGAVDCLVATPGRLKDLLQDGTCRLSQVEYLVLDEADRMLDMGFEQEVRRIVEQCKSKEQGRQTAMFSATWPAAIQKIAMEYMVDPVRVYVGFEAIVGSNSADGSDTDGAIVLDDSLSANKRVTQNVEVIDDHQRADRLRQLLGQVHGKRNNRVLVFALYKKEAERLERSLQQDGWHCGSIHGNKTQVARTAALKDFKDGSCPLLIATDVAARGLDIPNVEVVINFTFPLTIEDYVHRIGRTGRAGQTGVSYTFFQPGDKSHAGELQQVMKQAGQSVPDALMKFGSTIKKKEHKLYGNFGPKDGQPMKKATKIVFDHSDDES